MSESRSNNKVFGISINQLILTGVFFMIGFFNPNKDIHHREVEILISSTMENDLGDWGWFNTIKEMGVGLVNDNLLSIENFHNYIFISVGEVYYGGVLMGKSYGFCGYVNFVEEENKR